MRFFSGFREKMRARPLSVADADRYYDLVAEQESLKRELKELEPFFFPHHAFSAAPALSLTLDGSGALRGVFSVPFGV
jgi:hypothetical protein